MSIYLDYNASAPVDPRVLDVMISVYKNGYGNADSRTHNYGDNARRIVEKAREQVADLLNVSPDEVFFTSGATESNNIALQGIHDYVKQTDRNHLVTSSIEHKAVLETVKYLKKTGMNIDFVSPGYSGRVNASDLYEKIDEKTALVSLMHVNNETGIIQPVEKVGQFLYDTDVLFHIDATQSCGKLVDELGRTSYDILSFSAHKLSGPQGIGGLVLRKKNYKLPPVRGILFGGQQEHGIRPGTVPVALVAGLGEACRIAKVEYKQNNIKAGKLKCLLLSLLKEEEINYSINGDQEYCIPNTINICFENVASEAIMLATKQFCAISNGSACTSRSYTPSYVLEAMGLSEQRIENSVRISWGHDTDEREFQSELRKMLLFVKSMQE